MRWYSRRVMAVNKRRYERWAGCRLVALQVATATVALGGMALLLFWS